MKLGELIEALGGKLVAGDRERLVNGVNSVELAGEAELVFAEDATSAAEALASKASMVVMKAGCAKDYPQGKCAVEAEQPRLWFARAAGLLKPALPATGVHPAAVVGANVKLGEGVSIGPCAVVGENARIGAGTRVEAGAVVGEGVCIGEKCRIFPRAVLYPGTTLRNRVMVHAGVVLGADGFGYVRDEESGAYTQFPQQGTLLIEDDVEIGANTTIDRGALKQTKIGRGTKFDNLVHVGHNCEIGEDVILVAGVGISGSCTVGNGAVIAGQVGIGDHAHIGPGVILGGQAGVLSGKTITNEGMGVKPGTVLWGTPARPLSQVLREIAVLTRLAKRQGKGTSHPSD
ncbi:MAG TPA: UDP-3-O-(3-hydroxymyristoyl)glucosamine N-acyltransferase [Terracidiphilus sp.]|nr:UDP-3-O-(3-hydroxymyristoyl)glucosamine N-acyltransferase [Terracidiphilus sp.]